MNDPVLLDPDAVAHRLTVGRTTVFKLMATGQLRSVRVGRLRRVPVSPPRRACATALAPSCSST